jgi:6,7-dimethyl-8-ribityllumazine synthase
MDARELRMAVVVSRFNHPVSARLLEGCVARLEQLGCPEVDVVWVPGAFEIPLAAQTAAETGRYDAIVALGAVIRGDTPHFEYVCRAVTDGVLHVNLDTRVPVAFGVITVESVEQALDRAAIAGEEGSNKGAGAADVAIEMARGLQAVRKGM